MPLGMGLMGCSQIFLTVGMQDLQVDQILIGLVDMGFSRMFSNSHCRYARPTGEFGFYQTGRHGFQWGVLRLSLNHCRYARPTCGSGFNQTGRHGFQ